MLNASGWNGHLVTVGGKEGLLLPPTDIERRRRVAMRRDGGPVSSDPKEWSKPGREVTVWLYNDDGTIAGDTTGEHRIVLW